MARARMLALGVLTLLPLLLLGVGGVLFATTFLSMWQHPPTRVEGPPPLFRAMFAVNCLYLALLVGLALFYAVHAMRNPRIEEARRPLWLVVLLLGAPLSMPVYWYLYLYTGLGARGQEGSSQNRAR
jgi:O-antigen/teichoic acid export membrane protein